MAKAPEPYKILGLNLHPVDTGQVRRFMEEVIQEKGKALVLNLNIHCVNLAGATPWLKQFLNEAPLVFCDGDGVRLGLWFLGMKPPPKITYNQWMWQVAAHCEEKDFSLYFLGGRPGVSEEARQQVLKKHPRLRIVGVRDGYFQKQGPENEAVVEEINRLKPDILVTGFGMPVQEQWLSENWKRIDAHIFLNGGAVFDYLSGRLAKAPAWMVRFHLEWLFRLFQEPRRLFKRYVLGNPYFFYRIFKEKMQKKDEVREK